MSWSLTRPVWAPAVLAILLSGPAGAQDSDRADWLRQPAMGNYKAYAEFKMGHYAAAREVWQVLASIGNGDALFNLAILAEDGLGEAVDLRKAEQLYLAAAQSGNFKAQYRLGMLYSDGSRWPIDLARARRFLAEAAAHGDRDAQERLATLGQDPGQLSPYQQAEWMASSGQHEEAARLYQRLIAAGDVRSRTRLAWMYEAGRGVPRQLDEAARLFESAARDGDAEAQYALSVMYRTGQGRPRDTAAADHWLQQAAQAGYPAAQAALQADSTGSGRP